MSGFINGYYTFSVWITRLAYLNFLWVIFTLLGLGLFGIMPATVAMFAVVRKWNMGEKDIAIFKLFWQTYRQEFVKANVFGLILFGLGYILSIEFQIISTQTSLTYLIVRFSILAIALLYVIILLYFFPIFVHFNLRTLHYLKWPFIIGVIHPILTVFLFISIGLLHYVTFITVPALLFFFGASVTAFIIMWGVSKTFSKYEAAA
ncbi:DUF624 domain-containing protein [Ornithinibacillus gellani]|uniref:YesL family protein n=1 Tax=Ornithinibacillus gellani TaxID=2293253 RepID=UPI000F4A2572|nr:YesL family protein [Ornithinibacillus gellani]TQS71080.1 DUF624 domain-containing protein [Ornithinibacillus gellani]